MWTTTTQTINNGFIIRPELNDTAVDQQTFFRLLATERDYRDSYNKLLAATDLAAYFWEFPAMSAATQSKPVEFAIINAPTLARVRPQPAAFTEHFSTADGASSIRFANLSGDSELIVPVPGNNSCACEHLASFVRSANKQQLDEFWKLTADTVLDKLSSSAADNAFWLSTSGLGVSWLHVRLDSWPKYYQYGPYKEYTP